MRTGPRRRQQQRQRELPRSPGDGASGAEVNDVPPGGPSDENHAKWCRINVIRRGPPSTSPAAAAALLFALSAQPGFRRGLPVLFVIKMAVRGCPQLLRSSSVRVRAGAGWRAVGDKSGGRGAALQPGPGDARELFPPGPPPGTRSKTGPSPKSKQPLHKGLAEPETSSRADSAPGGTPAKLSGAQQRLGKRVCPTAGSFGLPRCFLFTPSGETARLAPGFRISRDLESRDCSQSPPTWARTNNT